MWLPLGIALAASASLAQQAGTDIPKELTLTYERSNFLATGRYEEAIQFCQALARRSPFAKVINFGKSPEGRPMVALLISRDRTFDPKAMRSANKPLIFVQNGIHSGEIEGKDATLLLARDLLISEKHPELLRQANWVIVPVYSVDSHERFSPYNRINQNGPVEMGWRATGQNYNLNRDYTKLDSTEAKNLVGLLSQFRPDYFFDNHTTDGADWQFVVGVSAPPSLMLPPELQGFQQRVYDAVKSRVDRDGYLVAPYFSMNDTTNPAKGISVQDFSPRYSHGYVSATGRPAMLVETHMLKPYRQRVEATYWVMVRTVEQCIAEADLLIKSRSKAAEPLSPGESLVLSTRPDNKPRPFLFKGWKFAPYQSAVTGTLINRWDHTPIDTPTTISNGFLPAEVATAPYGYIIPAAWTEVIEKLKLHGVPLRTLSAEWTDKFSSWKLSEVAHARAPFEGRFQPRLTATPIEEVRTLAKGSILVAPTRIAMHLLEPNAPDSFLRWGLFNTVLESKEYAEAYKIEPVAAQMLAESPTLAEEWRLALVKNPQMSASERLDWFYVRSPYYDQRYLKYPVARLSESQWKLQWPGAKKSG